MRTGGISSEKFYFQHTKNVDNGTKLRMSKFADEITSYLDFKIACNVARN